MKQRTKQIRRYEKVNKTYNKEMQERRKKMMERWLKGNEKDKK